MPVASASRFICKTDEMPLAAFLILHGLEFLRCEPLRRAHMAFVFADPNSITPGLELEYSKGASAPAKALFTASARLRDAARAAYQPEQGVRQ